MKLKTQLQALDRTFVKIAFLIGLCLLVFSQVAGYSFVNYDDFDYISRNPWTQSGLKLRSILWALLPQDDWMPLSRLSHLAAFQFFGSAPSAHHIINLLIHIANVLLVFYIFRLWTKDPWGSLAVAALFAIHPVQVESVAWVTARKDLLSAFFGLLTMLAYRHPLKNYPRSQIVLAPLLFFLSLAAKPTLIALPLILALMDKKLSKKLLPLFFISIFFCFITWNVQQQMVRFIHPTPLIFRIAILPLFYLGKVLFPHPLTIYGRTPPEIMAFWQILGSIATLLTISGFLFLKRSQYRLALIGWLWFLLCLAPTLILEVPADRYLYFAILGILIAIFGSMQKTWVAPAAFIAIVVCFPLSYAQAGYWKNSSVLFLHALNINEKNYTAHGNLAETLVDEKKYSEAAAHYFRVLELNPHDSEALTSLGVVYEKQNDFVRAESFHRQALRIKPGIAQTHFNLSNVLQKTGRKTEALEQLIEATKLKPDFSQSFFNAAELLEGEGRSKEAIFYYESALATHPAYTNAHNNLGLLLAKQGRYPEAVAHFSKILKLESINVEARNNLAIVLAKSGDFKTAIWHLEKIIREHPESSEARANLEKIHSKIKQG